jgi:hypothetical protein
MTKLAVITAVVGATIRLSGCASSRIHFEEPVGSRLYLEPRGTQMEGEEYALPVAIDLPQTDNPITLNADVGGRPMRMSLTDGTKLNGFLYVYKLNMDQVERLAEVTFRLTDEQITKLKSGYAVTVLGYSARKRPVYKVNLGLDR